MNTDDYTQPLEAVMRAEKKVRLIPMKVRDHMELFEEWARINPEAMREIELTALAIDARGIRVSAVPHREATVRRTREAQPRDVLRRGRRLGGDFTWKANLNRFRNALRSL